MDLQSDSYLQFCNCFWIVLVHMVFLKAPMIEIRWIQTLWMWWPLWNATSANQSTCKAGIQPFHTDVRCMGSCTVLLEPLLFPMDASMGRVCSRTCWEPQCNALYWSPLSLQHYSQTKTDRLCHVSIWQPMWCTLQSPVISEGLYLVLEIPRTQSSCCWNGLIERSGLHHWTTHSK